MLSVIVISLKLSLTLENRCAFYDLVQIENLVEYIWTPPHTHTLPYSLLNDFTTLEERERDDGAKGDKKTKRTHRRGNATFTRNKSSMRE